MVAKIQICQIIFITQVPFAMEIFNSTFSYISIDPLIRTNLFSYLFPSLQVLKLR